MNSRDAILAGVRGAALPLKELPELPASIAYGDPVKQFAETLAGVGGRCIRVGDIAEADRAVRSLDVYAQAKRVVTLMPGVGLSNVDVNAMKDPHELEGIDVAILPGQFAVAENAAVWVAGSALGPQRAIFVIAQHLVLVVRVDGIVSNMHQAYERISLERPGFGVFISGPSKTADIEQSLVIGAHGPRSCTVLLV